MAKVAKYKNVNEEDDRPSTVAPGIKGYKEPNTWCDKIEGTVEEDKSAEETEYILKNNGGGGKECEAGFVRVSSSQRENKYHGRMECDRNTNELVEEMVVGGSSCEGNENGGCDEDVYVIPAENEYKKQSFTVAAGVPTVDATVDDQEKHGYTQQTVERSATPAVEYPVDDPEDNGSIQQTDEFIKSMHNHVKDNKDNPFVPLNDSFIYDTSTFVPHYKEHHDHVDPPFPTSTFVPHYKEHHDHVDSPFPITKQFHPNISSHFRPNNRHYTSILGPLPNPLISTHKDKNSAYLKAIHGSPLNVEAHIRNQPIYF
ncbi:hypothetical protein L2E82_10460 [Cichorium intybus]|uniref:Uncharacterized protein n=1 Tax=Cichorium intybus TaxID=13427 RepID=A0ACB9GAF4_CICIN|nr:hypothetical protein L2E82_10460 [Cichorium intybus]